MFKYKKIGTAYYWFDHSYSCFSNKEMLTQSIPYQMAALILKNLSRMPLLVSDEIVFKNKIELPGYFINDEWFVRWIQRVKQILVL